MEQLHEEGNDQLTRYHANYNGRLGVVEDELAMQSIKSSQGTTCCDWV